MPSGGGGDGAIPVDISNIQTFKDLIFFLNRVQYIQVVSTSNLN